MRAIILAVLLAIFCHQAICYNIGRFQTYQSMLAESGLVQAVQDSFKTQMVISDQHEKRSTTKDELYIDLKTIKLGVPQIDPSFYVAKVAPGSNETIEFKGLLVDFDFKFDWADDLGEQGKEAGVADVLYNGSSVDMNVTYQFDQTSGQPKFTTSTIVTIVLNPYTPRYNLNTNNTTVKRDILEVYLHNQAAGGFLSKVQQQVNTAVAAQVKIMYDQRAASYQTKYNYVFEKFDTSIDMKIASLSMTLAGISWMYPGTVTGVPAQNATLPQFNLEAGEVQVAYAQEFLKEMVDYGTNIGAFVFNFTGDTFKIPGFDFRIADIWMIFPDSRSDYKPGDPTRVNCKVSYDDPTGVNLDVTNQIVQIYNTLKCTLIHQDSTDKILEFSVPLKYDLNIRVDDTGKARIRVAKSFLGAPPTINVLKRYALTPRAANIIESVIVQGLQVYDLNKDIAGTNFMITPMQGADYRVGPTAVTVVGAAPPVKNTTMSHSDTLDLIQ